MPVNELSRPLVIEKGNPLWNVTMLLSIQPFTSFAANPFSGLFGICQTFENLKLLGTSSFDRP